MQEPHSFLIVALRRIGDVLLTTPLIHSVRQRYPDAHIALLVFKGTGAILEGNTDISRVIEVPENEMAGNQSFLARAWPPVRLGHLNAKR